MQTLFPKNGKCLGEQQAFNAVNTVEYSRFHISYKDLRQVEHVFDFHIDEQNWSVHLQNLTCQGQNTKKIEIFKKFEIQGFIISVVLMHFSLQSVLHV